MVAFCLSLCFKFPTYTTDSCTELIKSIQSNYGNYNITIRSPDVHVTCVNDTTLAGSSNVTCQKNHKWHPEFPYCLVNCPLIPPTPNIISANTITYVTVRSSYYKVALLLFLHALYISIVSF